MITNVSEERIASVFRVKSYRYGKRFFSCFTFHASAKLYTDDHDKCLLSQVSFVAYSYNGIMMLNTDLKRLYKEGGGNDLS
jgi:hypothetical protein